MVDGNHFLRKGQVVRAENGWFKVQTHCEFFGPPEYDCSVTYQVTIRGDETFMERVPSDSDTFLFIPVSQREALRLKLAQRKCELCRERKLIDAKSN